MLKCEVLDNTVLAIGKGSIVYVSERQFNLARKVLKPINEEEKKVEATVSVDIPKKETRKKKKEN
jgi:hypothetical protein